ncbi:hypothetical protein GCM10009716_05200 [Streptomyces sodiiphilus]|uniref:Uncharacterized protein n=1 Tax=Streptomyces sodiiphilus TaxID=226217 RepID=A0ABN2NRN2_9ACTN
MPSGTNGEHHGTQDPAGRTRLNGLIDEWEGPPRDGTADLETDSSRAAVRRRGRVPAGSTEGGGCENVHTAGGRPDL